MNGEPGPNYNEIHNSWVSVDPMLGIYFRGNEGLS